MKRLFGVVACLAIALAVVPHAQALCVVTEAGDTLSSPVAAVLPADGGILVGWVTVSEVKPENVSATWTVTADSQVVSVTRQTLAPGLTLLRPAPGTSMLTVASSAGELARYTRDAKVPAFAPGAPAPTRLELTTRRARSGFLRTVTATLSAPVPGDAIGVITYAVRKKKKVALAFSPVVGGSTTAVSFMDAGRCSFNPSGMDAPKTGEKVTLVWVDAFGRLSKPSAPIAMIGTVPKGRN